MAYDKINGCHRFDNHYTNQQEEEVVNYIGKQLARVDIPDLTAEEKELMLNRMYSMYANPLINKLKAEE
ncbi:MAG: hypothetical protein K2H32_07170 [Muribaculaceae bacterium]|nr:hypothetical protein [Muribaculaceae bacterium]